MATTEEVNEMKKVIFAILTLCVLVIVFFTLGSFDTIIQAKRDHKITGEYIRKVISTLPKDSR